jgi:hypothetical protein
MKLGKLGSSIQTMITPLARLGATDSVKALNLLCSLFDDLKDIEVDAFIEKSKAIRASGDQGPTVGAIGEVLTSVSEFMRSVGASTPKKALIEIVKNCLMHAESVMSFAAFSHQIKTALLIDVVEFHLKALETSLGTPDFDAAYSALERDARVTGPKLAEIATRFVSRTGKSAPKRQMLQRIYARHASIVDIAKKNEWQRGKSAA